MEGYYPFIQCQSMNHGRKAWGEMQVVGQSSTIRFVSLNCEQNQYGTC